MSSQQTEIEFLRGYDPRIFERPNCTVDIAIFTVFDAALQVLLVKRGEHPFKDCSALAGGFVDPERDSDLLATAQRVLEKKTGATTPYLEQYGTVGNSARDPRGWTVTTVYFALVPIHEIHISPGKDADTIRWAKVTDSGVDEALAFDHAALLAGCLERLRGKVLYTSLPMHLMPPAFSLGDLQKVYELIMNVKLEHKSFRRRMLGAGLLEETGEARHEGRRPAQLYRAKEKLRTHFFPRNLEGSGSAGE